MAQVTLDIATKVVSDDQQIWSVFPGLGRKFYGQFINEGAIFLDTPGLQITEQILKSDELLRKHVAMSMAWVKYYYGSVDEPPSRKVSDYPATKNASFNAIVGNVRHVFIHMKPGDLVLVGGYTLYDPILVGELIEPYDPKIYVQYERYERERIPARRVKWLRVNYERRFLPQDLSRLLSNRRAVINIDKQRFGDDIYKVAYGDYVSGTDSRYIYKGPKYNNIAVSTVPGIDLISYFSAAFNAYDEGELDQFVKFGINDAIRNYFEQDVLYSFEIDFSSPGSYVLHAKRAALPLLVAVLVSATSGTISLEDARNAEITNSVTVAPPAGQPDHADDCTVEIDAKYKAIMHAINADQFNELCNLNKDAQAGVGLKVDVKQKVKK